VKRFLRLFLAVFLLSLVAAAAGTEIARLKLQEGLSRFLGVPVRVQRLTFSSRRLTLHGVSFRLPVQSPLRIDRLRMEGSLWSVVTGKLFTGPFPNVRSVKLTGLTVSVAGVPLQAEGKVHLRGRPGAYAQVEGLLTIRHPMLSGEVEIGGPLLKPAVFGWVEAAPVGRRHFAARLDITREAIGLSQMQVQGGWTATGGLVFRQPSWRGQLDVAGPDGRFRFRIEPGKKDFTKAMLWVHLEDAAPKEFSARWRVRRGQLEFETKLLEGQAVLTGQVQTAFPYKSAVALDVNRLELAEIADWIPRQSSKLAGKVQGKVEVSGLLGRVTSSGELIAAQGRFGRLEFNRIAIRFRGKGPFLQLENSYLAGRGGMMQMEGLLDARRIGRSDFFRHVKLSPMPGAGGNLDVAGFQVMTAPGDSGVEVLATAPGSKTTIGVAYQMDTQIPQEPVEREGLEVRHAVTPEQNVKIKIEKEERIIAVEHRKKF